MKITNKDTTDQDIQEGNDGEKHLSAIIWDSVITINEEHYGEKAVFFPWENAPLCAKYVGENKEYMVGSYPVMMLLISYGLVPVNECVACFRLLISQETIFPVSPLYKILEKRTQYPNYGRNFLNISNCTWFICPWLKNTFLASNIQPSCEQPVVNKSMVLWNQILMNWMVGR